MLDTLTPASTTVPGVPGATIQQVDALPASLENSVRAGGYSVGRPGALLQLIPRIGRMLSTGGQLIQFTPQLDADPLEVEQYLMGSARAALVHQRGGLPLHAACLVPPGGHRAIAIAGLSGVGKSTLAAHMVRTGWSLLGDDVTPLYSQPNQIMAWPSRGLLKLWRDACSHLQLDAANLQGLPGERDKYILPVTAAPQPVPLGSVFFLQRGPNLGLTPIHGAARLAALHANTYKPTYLPALGCVASHFRISCQISAQVEMGTLTLSNPVSDAELLLDLCTFNKQQDQFPNLFCAEDSRDEHRTD